MIRFLYCFVLASLLSACNTLPVVYGPNDTNETPPSGEVSALKELLPKDGRRVRLVFVHGVGDTCYGYALGKKDGWLNDETAERIGLHSLGDPSPPQTVYANVFMGDKLDPHSYVQYVTRPFSLRLRGIPKEISVDAIEITWSHLTQWIKSNQLGYDSPSTTPTKDSPSSACVEPSDESVPSTKSPPKRLLLDRTIKELIFDRNLADAILYSGTYGPVIEQGVAEALCHAISGSEDNNVHCKWPSADAAGQKDSYGYFFVTHSLGSRIIYDMFLDLLGYGTDTRPSPFAGQQSARPFVSNMLANTQAFYMMANQISLLGLANIPTDARSDTGAHPYIFPGPTLKGAELEHLASLGVISAKQRVRKNCNAIAAIAIARAAEMPGEKKEALKVITFNDTNDLLTWHVPPWYGNSGPGKVDCRPEVDVVNVFVQNTAHWFIAESPGPAHANYFKNGFVWDVITCGAKRGSVSSCRDN